MYYSLQKFHIPTPCDHLVLIFDVLLTVLFFFENVYCSEFCGTEIHLDTRVTKCSHSPFYMSYVSS